MQRVAAWFQALRAHFLTATVAPMLVGTAAAWASTHRFNLGWFLLAFAGAILVHLGANMGNDYFDFTSGTDKKNVDANELSGGSRVITMGLIPARQVLAAALTCFLAGSLIGLFLVWRIPSIPVLAIGVVGVFFAWFYTAVPLRLGYRGFAELLNGISFGPIIAMGAWFVQAPVINATGVLASAPSGILLACLLMINEFPDYASDKAAGKRTFVVQLGKRRALSVYHAALLSPFLWVAVFAAAGLFPAWTLLALAALPLAVAAWRISSRHYDAPAKLVGANLSTFFLHISFCLLFALGFLIEGL